MQRSISYFSTLCLSLLLGLTACQIEENPTVTPLKKVGFQNDVIKRTLGPNVVGLDLEFAFAMALPSEEGKLVSAEVEASIGGASGTYLEHRSYYTNGSGDDIGVVVGQPSSSEGPITRVNFTADTSAATLRYYYKIPEAARGQQVSFKFISTSSTGEKITYEMGPYTIAKMDMKLDMTISDSKAAYLSIADMAVYTAEEAAQRPDKIDLVYLYRSIPNITFNHALVSPVAEAQYRPDVLIPSGLTNSTRISKVWNLRDFHLARLQFGIYIDDLDFEVLNLSEAPNYAINLRSEAGAWVETADGKYRAYVYINAVNNSAKTARISIKRYTLQ
ncbi:DUF4466 family protein [Arundinibacter roseus]|uniref:DUF4466 domain-containing protein n=1 Tax=Arundinibacter roseus TaxID=2070510 RepID=A0A4R4KBP6_9BACT|nr:DUF4466 family protein [Arundinibacter roseus]TDB65327.1 DUF4466 domain-containing protein [Arundinibacter roseus]